VPVQADSIPGFADEAHVCGHKVPFLRKAQLLAADLYTRFRSESPLFAFEDAHLLGPDTGASAVAWLRLHGCIECSSGVSRAIAEGKELLRGDKEGSLRAACDVATRAVAASLQTDAWKLSRWLQVQVQAGKVEGLVQHITKNTGAY
jgi:hypothetical protein